MKNANPTLQIQPSARVEFMVHPKLSGPDAAGAAPELAAGWNETVSIAPDGSPSGPESLPAGRLEPTPVDPLLAPLGDIR